MARVLKCEINASYLDNRVDLRDKEPVLETPKLNLSTKSNTNVP